MKPRFHRRREIPSQEGLCSMQTVAHCYLRWQFSEWYLWNSESLRNTSRRHDIKWNKWLRFDSSGGLSSDNSDVNSWSTTVETRVNSSSSHIRLRTHFFNWSLHLLLGRPNSLSPRSLYSVTDYVILLSSFCPTCAHRLCSLTISFKFLTFRWVLISSLLTLWISLKPPNRTSWSRD